MDERKYADQTFEEYLNYARRNLLNILEASYGQTESWSFVRSRVLQIFGQNGLNRFSNKQKEINNGTEEKSSKLDNGI